MQKQKRRRLDLLMVEYKLAESRSLAQRLILAGRVRVNGQEVIRPGEMLAQDARVEITVPPRFVSRGGEKLDSALERFAIRPVGWICADVGASTGGFTDCLLQHEAKKVYAIDVGKGILEWRLRNDPRIILMEGTNARWLAALPEPLDFVTIDASFISLRLLFPVICQWLKPSGQAVVLIKPQFEAGRGQVGKGGVVRDPIIHRRVLTEVLTAAEGTGFSVAGLIPSPLKGPAGNIEFLAHLKRGTQGVPVDGLINSALTECGG